jgi:hypothetical protein
MMPPALRVECSLILHSYRIEHRADTISANLRQVPCGLIAIGIGIAVAVGFDIDPDSDCDPDPDPDFRNGDPFVRKRSLRLTSYAVIEQPLKGGAQASLAGRTPRTLSFI